MEVTVPSTLVYLAELRLIKGNLYSRRITHWHAAQFIIEHLTSADGVQVVLCFCLCTYGNGHIKLLVLFADRTGAVPVPRNKLFAKPLGKSSIDKCADLRFLNGVQ